MKRYHICAQAKTTGQPLVYTVSDSPAEALQLAKKLHDAGGKQVEIHDSHAEKFYDLKAFAAEHRLG